MERSTWLNMPNIRREVFVRRFTRQFAISIAFGAGLLNTFAPPAQNCPRNGKKISIREKRHSGGLSPNKHGPNG
jgi:hypothetical protein